MDTKLLLSTSGALEAQGEIFVVHFDGDFDAHDHCGHTEPYSGPRFDLLPPVSEVLSLVLKVAG